MHIPDGVLAPSVLAGSSIVALAGLVYGTHRLRGASGDRTPVLMGSTAAFVFAAQMVNFPVPFPGVSGHLMGGTLVAVLLGPWAGALVIGAVLVVQCFLLGDGGLTALGANFINMGLVGSVGGYAIFAPIRRLVGGPRGVLAGAMVASWFAVILASGAFALELALSRRGFPFLAVLGWMALVHAAIGLGEALITGTVVRFLLVVRPDLVDGGLGEPDGQVGRPGGWGSLAAGMLAVALAVAAFLAPLASKLPDGLEYIGGSKVPFLPIGPSGATLVVAAPVPDDALPGLTGVDPGLATAAAGFVGTLVVFGAAVALARGLVPATRSRRGIDAA